MVTSKSAKPEMPAPRRFEGIEVSGTMLRTEWETLYLTIKKMAKQHGFSIESFDLKAVPPEAPKPASVDQDRNQSSGSDAD